VGAWAPGPLGPVKSGLGVYRIARSLVFFRRALTQNKGKNIMLIPYRYGTCTSELGLKNVHPHSFFDQFYTQHSLER